MRWIMENLRFVLAPSMSVLALVLYFSPWYFDSPLSAVLYLLAFVWFAVAWIPMLIHGVLAMLHLYRGAKTWRLHLAACGVMALVYLAWNSALSHGFILTA